MIGTADTSVSGRDNAAGDDSVEVHVMDSLGVSGVMVPFFRLFQNVHRNCVGIMRTDYRIRECKKSKNPVGAPYRLLTEYTVDPGQVFFKVLILLKTTYLA
jgi:hypothetical protein